MAHMRNDIKYILVWKDLENQAMVAVSRDLTRQGCNAIPNYRTRVVTIFSVPLYLQTLKIALKV